MTSKRARHVSGKGAVWHMSSEQATLAKMPKYNGYACGYGAHGNAKYHRAKSKRAWKAQMQKEGASRGSFPFPVLALVAADRCRKNGAGLRRVWHRVPSRPIMSQLLIAGSMG